MRRVKLVCSAWIVVSLLLLTGCAQKVYEVTHPTTGKIYETLGYRTKLNGSIEFTDRWTDEKVVLREYTVRRAKEKEFR